MSVADIEAEDKYMKLSKGLEEVILNFQTERLDRKILKGLINFEEKDGNELIFMIKRMEAPNGLKLSQQNSANTYGSSFRINKFVSPDIIFEKIVDEPD